MRSCARPCRSRRGWSPCATLDAGERPSYGRLRPLPARSLVATVPIGYADGVPRALFGAGYEVLIGGVRRPLAGMVTMDQIVVDCGDDDSVRPGDEVVLLGRQGDEAVTADDWAALLGTISYEVVCGVGPAHAPPPGQPARRARVPDADVLERLRLTASTCTLCPLAEGRTQVVFGVGNPAADLLFVGEGPGREEDLAGEPFVGRSGKLLDRLMWEEVGLTRAECYIANVVKCRPPNNRDPAPDEIEACRPYLTEQVALIDPTVIVTLGNFATKLLLESTARHPPAAGPGLRARAGQPRPDVPSGLRAAGRRGGHGRDAGRPRPGQAPQWRPDGRELARSSVRPTRRRPPRSWRDGWRGCAARATSCCSSASSALARRCSPRASPPRSGWKAR